VSFSYGPNRQRWKTAYIGSIGTETTYHVGKLLEKVINGSTTDYRHYIFAGKELVGIYSRMNSGTNTLRYALEDHQSSFASILTSAGTTEVNESFTAYGLRRSGSTWSGAPTGGDETAINNVSRWGYTGHTALGVTMGLNHMNGRVEDSIIGRFLSPDPNVPDPGNTQSWNRYSYVNNNPLTMMDPSGFWQVQHFTLADGGDIGPPGISIGTLGQWTYFAGGDISNGDLLGPPPPRGDPGPPAPADTGSAPSGTATTKGGSGRPASDPGSPGSPAQSQTSGGGTTVWNDPNDASAGLVACGDCVAGSTAGTVSAISGWAAIGTGVGDFSSGTTAIGTNGRFYSAPRGNQYFRTLTKLDTVFKFAGAGALVVGTFADYYDAFNGDGSMVQANLNAAIGAAGLLSPLYFVPGSMYFAISQNYPGGPAAYNAAYSQQLNAAEGGGP
jgi:RHS repeat-associated protein